MDSKYFCPSCGHEFQQGEWDYDYETARLVFVCPECDWEGDENEVENDDEEEFMIWDGCYDKRKLKKQGLDIMVWPDSQELMTLDGFRENTWLINDTRGLNRFGSCAYVYDIEWYNNMVRVNKNV